MGRILAIDYGRKRTGLAVTDPLQMISTPLTTVSTSALESFIAEYTKNEAVEKFVVGYPLRMNNKPSESVKYVEPFIKRLKKLYPSVPVIMLDERFTSKIAIRSIIEGGVRKKQRKDKGLVDRISASIILQSYIEKRSFLKEKES